MEEENWGGGGFSFTFYKWVLVITFLHVICVPLCQLIIARVSVVKLSFSLCFTVHKSFLVAFSTSNLKPIHVKVVLEQTYRIMKRNTWIIIVIITTGEYQNCLIPVIIVTNIITTTTNHHFIIITTIIIMLILLIITSSTKRIVDTGKLFALAPNTRHSCNKLPSSFYIFF